MTPSDIAHAMFATDVLTPATVADRAAHELWRLAALVAFGATCAMVHRGLEAAEHPSAGHTQRRLAMGLRLAGGIGAAVLLGRVGRELGTQPEALTNSWAHLLFAALLGVTLRGAAPAARAWVLAALSLAIVRHYTQTPPLLIVGCGALVGFGALRAFPSTSRRRMALAQAAILLGTWALCWGLRRTDPLGALRGHALFAWVLLRHTSFVTRVHGHETPRLGPYLCYLFFYPSCFGTSEVYEEFAARNLGQTAPYDSWRATRWLIAGSLYGFAWSILPTPGDPFSSTSTGPVLWLLVLFRFASSACLLMSIWATVTATALLYGLTLRPNFQGLLSRRTPAAFWRAWRATMTNWLIHHVYIPLGGARHHRLRNIAIVFAVSTLWHWSGIPFLRTTIDPRLFVPVALWGTLNAAIVVAQVALRGSRLAGLAARVPAVLRVPCAILGTMAFGTLTTTFLGFMPDNIDRFPSFVARMLWMRP